MYIIFNFNLFAVAFTLLASLDLQAKLVDDVGRLYIQMQMISWNWNSFLLKCDQQHKFMNKFTIEIGERFLLSSYFAMNNRKKYGAMAIVIAVDDDVAVSFSEIY